MMADEVKKTDAFPFDSVVVADGGAQRSLSPQEFFALPLAQRISFVVAKKAVFYAAGREVDSKEALANLRRMRAQLH